MWIKGSSTLIDSENVLEFYVTNDELSICYVPKWNCDADKNDCRLSTFKTAEKCEKAYDVLFKALAEAATCVAPQQIKACDLTIAEGA